MNIIENLYLSEIENIEIIQINESVFQITNEKIENKILNKSEKINSNDKLGSLNILNTNEIKSSIEITDKGRGRIFYSLDFKTKKVEDKNKLFKILKSKRQVKVIDMYYGPLNVYIDTISLKSNASTPGNDIFMGDFTIIDDPLEFKEDSKLKISNIEMKIKNNLKGNLLDMKSKILDETITGVLNVQENRFQFNNPLIDSVFKGIKKILDIKNKVFSYKEGVLNQIRNLNAVKESLMSALIKPLDLITCFEQIFKETEKLLKLEPFIIIDKFPKVEEFYDLGKIYSRKVLKEKSDYNLTLKITNDINLLTQITMFLNRYHFDKNEINRHLNYILDLASQSSLNVQDQIELREYLHIIFNSMNFYEVKYIEFDEPTNIHKIVFERYRSLKYLDLILKMNTFEDPAFIKGAWLI